MKWVKIGLLSKDIFVIFFGKSMSVNPITTWNIFLLVICQSINTGMQIQYSKCTCAACYTVSMFYSTCITISKGHLVDFALTNTRSGESWQIKRNNPLTNGSLPIRVELDLSVQDSSLDIDIEREMTSSLATHETKSRFSRVQIKQNWKWGALMGWWEAKPGWKANLSFQSRSSRAQLRSYQHERRSVTFVTFVTHTGVGVECHFASKTF